MNLNQNDYSQNATRLNISRSKIPLNHKWTGSLKASQIVPVFSYSDILPGDTFKVDMSAIIRSTTPVSATMDDAFVDYMFFFVPHRLALGREMFADSVNSAGYSFERFIGAQYGTFNAPLPGEATILKSKVGRSRVVGTYADSIGLPSADDDYKVSALEALAYAKVWNDFFRDPNVQDPIVCTVSEGNVVFRNWLTDGTFTTYLTSLPLLNACVNHGMFGSCLPWPQRNVSGVTLPLGKAAEVIATVQDPQGGTLMAGTNITSIYNATYNNPSVAGTNKGPLLADLSNATAADINQVRLAFQTQKYFEELARSGNRYGEIKAGFFVTSGKDIEARAEYLGGKRINLQTSQVMNTSSDLGKIGAFSLTSDSNHYFTKSFDDWGTLLCVAVIRTRDSFYQGLHPRYKRFDRMDYYWPTFAMIGEVPVKKGTICMSDPEVDEQVFGYQEAWYDYRYLPDVVTGVCVPSNASYGYWTYAHNFSTVPSLKGFITKTYVDNVDQTLVTSSATAGFQFFMQCYFDITAIRPLPTYSIPGLIDHN